MRTLRVTMLALDPAGHFQRVHNSAIDSHGGVYTSELDTGKRAQRFARVP